MKRSARSLRSVFLLSVVLWLSGWSGHLLASSLERLTDKLLRHKSYKVRLQAAAVLGRLRDPRALGALGLCIRFDESYLVRAMCATAVGKIGVPEGRKILLAAAKDKHPFVRKMAARALRRLEDYALPAGKRDWSRPPRRRARVLVLLGTMNARGRAVGPTYRQAMRQAFWERLFRRRRLELVSLPNKPPISFLRKYRLKAYRLDATLMKLRVRTRRGQVTVSAKIRIALSEYPRSKIVMMTAAKATASQRFAGGRPTRKLYHQLKVKAIQGAVASVVSNVWEYLRSR